MEDRGIKYTRIEQVSYLILRRVYGSNLRAFLWPITGCHASSPQPYEPRFEGLALFSFFSLRAYRLTASHSSPRLDTK